MLFDIGFKDLRVTCIIGVLPHEREQEQLVRMDLELTYDVHDVADERLDNVISYAEAAGLLAELLVVKRFRLIENAAAACIALLFDSYPSLTSAQITIKKPDAIPDADFAFAKLHQDRHGTPT